MPRHQVSHAHNQRDRELRDRLNALCIELGIPGAVIAVQSGDHLVVAASGVLNRTTGVDVTADTLFQLGSITKLYTAALVMQLVDEGFIDLSTSIDEVLPEARAVPASPLGSATVGQLLSHTSGLAGDVFDDFGRGDDSVLRHVQRVRGLPRAGPAGEFSYSNSGYVVLGRVVEHLRGVNWDNALKQFLLTPLGAAGTTTLPEEALLRRAAVGHILVDGAFQPTPEWSFTRALGPAAGIVATARDVLAFSRALAHEGCTEDGVGIMSRPAALRMLEPQIALDVPHPLADSWGLGWVLYRAAHPLVIGHDGSTMGQQAFLRLVPERDLALVLLVNGGGGALAAELLPSLLSELADVITRQPAQPPSRHVAGDIDPFIGDYERYAMRLEFRPGPMGRIVLTSTITGSIAERFPRPERRELVMLDERTLITSDKEPGSGSHTVYQFSDRAERGYMCVHSGGRMTPRVEGEGRVPRRGVTRRV